LKLKGFPATLLYSPSGEFIAQKGGYMPPQATMAWLQSLRSR